MVKVEKQEPLRGNQSKNRKGLDYFLAQSTHSGRFEVAREGGLAARIAVVGK